MNLHRKIFYLFLLGITFIFTACAPIYRCGDPIPKHPIAGSSRLIAVVQERDSLCAAVNTKREEYNYLLKKTNALMLTNDSLILSNKELNHITDSVVNRYNSLHEDYVDLEEKHLKLSREYSTSITQNLTQGHLYDERIKEKERRLKLKEKLLDQREAKIKELEQKIAQRNAAVTELNRLLKQALIGFKSDELSTKIKDGKVYVSMSDKLMFPSGKAEVQPKGEKALGMLAQVLKKNTKFNILVVGHTDNVKVGKGSKFIDNWNLSTARSTSVIRILQNEYQINPHRLTASGKSQYNPRASNDTALGRAKNRRTTIILSPDLPSLQSLIKED